MSARTLSNLLAGILLALPIAVIGTVLHQGSLAGVPTGAVLALALAGFASVKAGGMSKTTGFSFAIALAALIFWTGLPHEDVMIPANLAGYLWSFGSVASSVLIAAFPKLK